LFVLVWADRESGEYIPFLLSLLADDVYQHGSNNNNEFTGEHYYNFDSWASYLLVRRFYLSVR
jgi:hypothetical protein